MSVDITESDIKSLTVAKRRPWPPGQFYIKDDFAKTIKLWDLWSDQDVLPLIHRRALKVRPEYIDVFTLKHHQIYEQGFYARGGLAWSVSYKHALASYLTDNIVPDIVYETSDFDLIECNMDLGHLGVDNDDEFLQLIDIQKPWPTITEEHHMSYGVQRHTTRVKLNSATVCHEELNDSHRYKLAAFFDQKLKIGGKPLNKNAIQNKAHETIFEDCGYDKRHDGNVDMYSKRYRLSENNPYLMRVPGFGFVETPTIQIGQILDSLNDYEMCAAQPANGFKAKYARRLARMKFSLRIHDALIKEGNTVKTCAFVLDDYVAEELRVADQNWGRLIEATDPDAKCYEFTTNREEFRITRGKERDCDEKEARMNCKALDTARPFRTASERISLYQDKDNWLCNVSQKRSNGQYDL